MSLTGATLTVALILLLAGGYLLAAGERLRSFAISSLRDRSISLGILIITSIWFLWNVLHLGESDFGKYRVILFVVFLAIAIGSWFYTPDFLGVRILSAFYLLCAGVFLNAAFGLYEIPQRLFMVSVVYLGIVFALYMAAAPFRMRDILNWLFTKPIRGRLLGAGMGLYGLLLLGVAISY